MLSLAIVSLSPCSAAISSRTGATILHGPHHSAQKSTSTGLSLPSTSSAKDASVTVTVLPAMVVLLVARGRPERRGSDRVDLSGTTGPAADVFPPRPPLRSKDHPAPPPPPRGPPRRPATP